MIKSSLENNSCLQEEIPLGVISLEVQTSVAFPWQGKVNMKFSENKLL